MSVRSLLSIALAVAVACGGDDGNGGPGPEDCSNGVDDNGDSFVDCADALCVLEAQCEVAESSLLVAGAQLTLQDASSDGAWIAYTDASGQLFIVSPDGGEPTSVAGDVERARYEASLLTYFRGVDLQANTADSLFTWTDTDGSTQVGELVVISTVRASADSSHLYYEERLAPGSGIKNLFLDGTEIVSESHSERARFSQDSNWLVIGADIGDGTGTTTNQVISFATSTKASSTLVAEGASNRFQITDDSQTVILAENERGPTADLTTVAIDGGASSSLVQDGSDRDFRILDDGTRLALLIPDNPDNPTTFSLALAPLAGGPPTTIIDAGAIGIDSASSSGVVYATAEDPEGRRTLRYVADDGSGDRELGTKALDDGFSSDEASYLFLDQTTTANQRPGRLQLYRPASDELVTLGTDVARASFVGADRAVFQGTDGILRLAVLSTGDVAILHPEIFDYEELPDSASPATSSRVAVSTSDGIAIIDLSE